MNGDGWIKEEKGMLVREITRKSAQEYQKIETLREKKQRLEKRMKRLEAKTHWTESLIRPIAKELAKELPDCTYEILGPFGLACEISIHFYKKGVPESERWDYCRSITFVHMDLDSEDSLMIVTKEETGEYIKETLGGNNGLNKKRVKMPLDVEVKELIRYVSQGKKP
jgi:hypothetical protein